MTLSSPGGRTEEGRTSPFMMGGAGIPCPTTSPGLVVLLGMLALAAASAVPRPSISNSLRRHSLLASILGLWPGEQQPGAQNPSFLLSIFVQTKMDCTL